MTDWQCGHHRKPVTDRISGLWQEQRESTTGNTCPTSSWAERCNREEMCYSWPANERIVSDWSSFQNQFKWIDSSKTKVLGVARKTGGPHNCVSERWTSKSLFEFVRTFLGIPVVMNYRTVTLRVLPYNIGIKTYCALLVGQGAWFELSHYRINSSWIFHWQYLQTNLLVYSGTWLCPYR